MQQLSLNIQPKLSYDPAEYILHSGVSETYQFLSSELKNDRFSIMFVQAPPRFGKTHLSIRIADDLVGGEKYPRLLDGAALEGWLGSELALETRLGAVFIVDDAHLYLLEKRSSGPFVDFVERVRVKRGKIILLSEEPQSKFPIDEHIQSRLLAGTEHELGVPDPEELESLIHCLAIQRGIMLSQAKIQYLLKRIARDIPSIERYFDRLIHLSQVLGRDIKMPLLSDAI